MLNLQWKVHYSTQQYTTTVHSTLRYTVHYGTQYTTLQYTTVHYYSTLLQSHHGGARCGHFLWLLARRVWLLVLRHNAVLLVVCTVSSSTPHYCRHCWGRCHLLHLVGHVLGLQGSGEVTMVKYRTRQYTTRNYSALNIVPPSQ
jgi:hypothetical protein